MTDTFLKNLAKEVAHRFPNEKIKLYSLQDAIDVQILEKFANILKENGLESEIYKNLSVDEALKELSGLEYLIGMRFHSALVAAKAGVKVLGINYDIKVLNLAKHIGFPIIGLKEESFSSEFNELINLDTSVYNIPEFRFPEI